MKFRSIVMFVLALLTVLPAAAERIKDLTEIQGVRANQLVGYGLIVGLDGTGDRAVGSGGHTTSSTPRTSLMVRWTSSCSGGSRCSATVR